MVLAGPGEFELRPEINPIKVLLVYNIFNSIIYFSLVRSRQNKVYATRHIMITSTTIIAMVRYFGMLYYIKLILWRVTTITVLCYID